MHPPPHPRVRDSEPGSAAEPTARPTTKPTARPTTEPTPGPTARPTAEPGWGRTGWSGCGSGWRSSVGACGPV
ncbi:PT domain-containing protein [Actinoplanes philippinensis]